MTIGKKIFLMSLAIVGLTLGAGLIYGASLLNFSTDAISKTFKQLDGEEKITPIDATEPLTILLMGVDMDQATRGGDWEGGRSDSMILVTVNPKTKETNMMSLTRDIMVEIAEANGESSGTVEKLNHSYSYGQAPMAIATIEKMMDINIDRYIEINMDGLVELVDAVGGIEVNNTLGFPISISEHEPAYTSIVQPGKQLVNGDQALVYARMRYDDPEGDIGRQRRQREVITAIIKKLLQLDGLTQYKKILTAISNNMRTNIEISPATIPSLLGYKDSVSKLNSYQLRGVDQMVDEIYYQLPTSEHLLEMQNILKKSIGLEEKTDLVTNVKVYEGQVGLPSPINVYDVYTNLLLLEASPWAESLDPEIGSPSATTTVTTEEQVTDFSTEPVLGDENGSQ
ncbi:LytR family transcriptional regulator [Streptococcus suis]|uniref:Cell envelope-related transcriptional attenuator n=2 Tax=Streptococcus suis TaxID=1307 RepID=G7SID2_STRSU|nr:LCP family protein [Streptococcus suis]AER20100.1 cell envelope-related transcriptional attenuator [Streptococcus suis D12]MBS8070678.1 LytR family transcriptional regulator [Streptococcus suis]MBS8094514.1 LytR family transcriptional regulator [Streptococcus suis]MBS8103439.1 LytR family transcriptional regulator [Streptococcus suis]MBY4977979.1 LCP family protein [Streptococcus suis]